MKKYLCLIISSLMLSSCASSGFIAKNTDDAAPVEDFAQDNAQVSDPVRIEASSEVQSLSIDDGTASSLYKKGVNYEEGKGVKVDLIKAESYYKKAMEQGSIDAMNALGVLYLGYGDYDQAKKYFEMAAKKDDEIANFNLGNLSFIGNKEALNLQALDYYQKSASKNYSPAFVALGDMYATGKGIEPDIHKAEEYYLKAADLNDDIAIDRLSLLYLLQDGTDIEDDQTKNSIKTVELFKRVADKGNPKAMYVLSLLYQNGFYVKTDNEKAVEYLKKSAELGYPEAEYSLSYLYLAGMYVVKDNKKGIQLMLDAANRNYPDAQNNIAMLYLKGEVVPKDLSLAKKWLERAITNGSIMASYNLGIVYDAGLGVPIDSDKAGQLYLKAANSGYAPAFSKIIEMYATGTKGVEKNNVKAREWLDKAVDTNDGDAMLLKANAYFYGNYGYAKDMALAKDWLEKAKALDNAKATATENNWKRAERYMKLQSVKR